MVFAPTISSDYHALHLANCFGLHYCNQTGVYEIKDDLFS